MDYLPLLKEQWKFTCLDFHLQSVFPIPKYTHCYDGQGIVQKAWLNWLNAYMSHLVFIVTRAMALRMCGKNIRVMF